jgi:hypothetical protein
MAGTGERENEMGPDALLTEIIDKRLWSNAEIAWVLRRLIFYFGRKDSYLKEAPIDRIFASMVDILRSFFILFDKMDPDIDDNMRTYICSKLADATGDQYPYQRISVQNEKIVKLTAQASIFYFSVMKDNGGMMSNSWKNR